MILQSIVDKLVNSSLIIDTIGLAIISIILFISTVVIIRSMIFRITDDVYINYENKLRSKYKRDNYFGPDHPDHFDYQRTVGNFTYFPNTKKAKQYYKAKRKVQNHQRNYKGYKKRYKKRFRY